MKQRVERKGSDKCDCGHKYNTHFEDTCTKCDCVSFQSQKTCIVCGQEIEHMHSHEQMINHFNETCERYRLMHFKSPFWRGFTIGGSVIAIVFSIMWAFSPP